MNGIPVVTMRRTPGGWSLDCSACDYGAFEFTRPDADIEGRDHQRSCGRHP